MSKLATLVIFFSIQATCLSDTIIPKSIYAFRDADERTTHPAIKMRVINDPNRDIVYFSIYLQSKIFSEPFVHLTVEQNKNCVIATAIQGVIVKPRADEKRYEISLRRDLVEGAFVEIYTENDFLRLYLGKPPESEKSNH